MCIRDRYLGIVAILPLIIGKIVNVAALSIGGTSVIIVVGVALETVQALESQMPVSYTHLRTNCTACIGQVGNLEHENVQIGKAGRKRHMGWRPTVRGSVMNLSLIHI